MPELPEVEVIKRQLEPELVDGKIVAITVLRTDFVKNIEARELEQKLSGKVIRGLRRQGKVLLLDFDDGSLAIRLGMTGKILMEESKSKRKPHTHWVLKLERKPWELRGVDPRRFGRLLWLADRKMHDMGIDAVTITADELESKLANRHIAIHKALLDQHILAGIGNIYACEALFRAGINPLRSSGSLTGSELQKLVATIKQVLEEAINCGGSTISDYKDAFGNAGEFAARHLVYGKAGNSCNYCGKTITRIVQNGRSIYYCPGCQIEGEGA